MTDIGYIDGRWVRLKKRHLVDNVRTVHQSGDWNSEVDFDNVEAYVVDGDASIELEYG